jgi:hypothetical protein
MTHEEIEEYRRNQLDWARQTDQKKINQQLPIPEKPISLGIFLFGLFLSLVGDVVDILTVGTIGWLIGIFIDLILLGVLGISRSGRKQFKKLIVGVIGETIPGIAIFPFRTVFIVWTYTSSNKEYKQEMGKYNINKNSK